MMHILRQIINKIKKLTSKRFLLSLFLIICTIFNLYPQEQGNLIIKNYSFKEINSETTWSILQDTNGLMYFGQEHGLLYYDGNEWRTISITGHNNIRSLENGKDGKLYVGSVGELGYVLPDSLGKLKYVSLINKIPLEYRDFQDVWFLKCIGNDVWFSSYKYLFRLRNGEFKAWKTKTDFFNIVENNNRIFVYEFKSGIKEIINDSIIPAPSGDFFKDKNFWAFLPLEKNKILIPTFNSGLYIYNLNAESENANQNVIQKFPTEADSLFLKYNPYSCIKLKNGNIAIGTISGGIVVLNTKGELIKHINKKSGLQNNLVPSLYEDKESNLWAGSIKGISKINLNSPISYWGEEYEMGASFNDIKRFKGQIYISKFEGIFTLKDNTLNQIQGINTPVFPLLDFINPEDTAQHILLAGTNLNSLIQVEGNKAIQLLPLPNNILALHQSKKDPSILFMGGITNLSIAKYENKKWQNLGIVKDITTEVNTIFEDNDGNLWIANRNKEIWKLNLSKDNILKPKKIRKYTTGEVTYALSSINTINSKLIFCNKDGLFTYNSKLDSLVHDTTYNKKFNDGSVNIHGIQKDRKGQLWISGYKDKKIGIACLNPNNGNSQWQEEAFYELPQMRISQIYIEDNKTIWIGGSEGLFNIKIDTNIRYPEYSAYINQVIINNDSTIFFGNPNKTTDKREVILPYSFNSLLFNYTATSFYDENRTKYQTFLEGFDKDWSEWKTKTQKEYTNLPEGKYTMRVRARNVHEITSKEAEYSFIINPPWARRPIAYFIYIFVLGFLIWFVSYLNSIRLKNINLELEETVRIRTKDLHEVNTELEEKQAELEVQQEEIIAQRDYVQEQNELIEQQNKKITKQNTELEKLSIVASETDNAITIMDAKGKFLWFNESYEKLYEYTFEEYKKIKGENIFLTSSNKNIKEILSNCIQNKKPINYESEVISSSGKKILTQVTITPILDKIGNVSKLISIESNIEKLKQYENEIIEKNKELEKHRNHLDLLVKERTIELEKAKEKAEESDRLKSAFLANMSHEIRTPMNAIVGFSELIADPDLEQDQKEDLSYRISQNCDSLLRLIDDIIDIAKIESDQLVIEKSEFNVNDLIVELSDIYKLKKKELNKDHIELIVPESNKLEIIIDSDKLRIKQVLINLMDNAFKFTEKGSIKFGYEQIENELKFYVSDSGIGLTKDQTKEIFNQFRKIETYKSATYRGAGLGLAISKNIVELLGGKINVESTPNIGSTFYFTIPK